MLGFSCDIVGGGYDEYGCPTADFVVNGNVKSSETDKPIENIKVVVRSNDTLDYKLDSIHTNANGFFKFSPYNFPYKTASYRFIFTDIDGAENGLFKKLDTVIRFEDIEYTGGDGNWYEGRAERNIDIELQPDNDSN